MIKSAFYVTIISLFVFSSCTECIKGVGEEIPETRSVEPFDAIELNSFINVSFRQIKKSGVDKVVVTAQENLLPYIKVTVENDELVLEVEECIETDKDITLEIYGRNLRSITTNGSGDFNSDGKLVLQKLSLENNGSGDMIIKTDAQSVELEANGSGDVTLSGSSDYLEVESNGSGDVEALELRTFEAETVLNGSGDISVYAKENLEVDINGAGDVIYKGKAKITKTLNGAGSLKSHK